MLNANFVAKVEEIMKQNNYPHIAQSKIEHCPRSIFMLPITENEVECVMKNSKVNFQQDMMKYRNMQLNIVQNL